MSSSRPYHHGDLRRALVAATVEAIEETGVADMSLRDVARRAGVTHTAAGYHFGDKAGLLTAVATEGYQLLGAALHAEHPNFLEMGVAYVRFALAHPGHFAVMYQPARYTSTDPALVAARQETAALLYGSRDATAEEITAGVAAWSIVHGFATLWLAGNIPSQLGDDPEQLARTVARHLRPPRRRRP